MNLFFDSIIFLYLVSSATFAAAVFRDRKRQNTFESRHPKLAIGCSVVLLFSFLVVIWGSFVEPRLITVNRVAIDFPNFEPTQPIRVALISDVHVGTYKKDGWVRRISERIIKEKPDLVLIAGDLIVEKPEHAQYLSSLKLLASSFPTYAVLGDHDYHVNRPHYALDEDLAGTVRQALTDAQIEVLRNETRAIEINGAVFTLVGLDDWMAGKTDMTQALSQLQNYSLSETSIASEVEGPSTGSGNKYLPILVLVHNPDFILDPQSKNADLILAGNTHGGQIRLPFIGPVPRLPSKLPRTFDEGLFTVHENTKLFITSGISESGPRARLFNPPEIVLLSLY